MKNVISKIKKKKQVSKITKHSDTQKGNTQNIKKRRKFQKAA